MAVLHNLSMSMKDMDEERYQDVLEKCALLPDLAVLPQGDLTEVNIQEQQQPFS